ncbi:CotH kinase family protein [Candidatus Fermentibacteria bacterium]|nr:CotH kinase family protein [Candidatus Fermentibacteria bacterium]
MRLVIVALLVSGPLAAYELHLNCGGPGFTSPSGVQFCADADYTPGGAGFTGGECLPPAWDPIGGTPMPELYATGRTGFDAFLADVPNGLYVMTLHLCELEKFGPGLRVMGLVAEESFRDTVDVFAAANHAYALRLCDTVTVADGQLTLRLESLYRPNILSGLELVSCSPDTSAPAIPQGFLSRSSYRSALLTWDLPPEGDAAGILVYRRHSGQEQCITAAPVPVPLLLDHAMPGPASYALCAVDVFGNASSATAWMDAQPMLPEDSPLPVFGIEVDPADLAILQDDPWTDTYVPASFVAEGAIYDPAGLRFRGNVGRRFTKKSYKIRLEDELFQGRGIVNLNADYADWSLLRSALSFDLFWRVAVRPPEAQHVHLELNGRFAGVYLDVEQPDERFLIRTGRDSTASIYKCNGNLGLLPTLGDYQRCYDKKTNTGTGHDDLIAFIEAINLSSTQALPPLLLRGVDVASYLRYYAVIVATANNDFTERNYYLVHDGSRDRWEVIPWDLDLTFGLGFPFAFEEICNPPIDVGTLASPQCIGGANMLLDRVLAVPAFKSFYARQLEHLLSTDFTPSAMAARIESIHGLVAPDAMLDVLKLGREDSTLFTGSKEELVDFVAMRHGYLLGELAIFAPPETLYVFLNEVQSDNHATAADEAGEFDPWLELWNMSPGAVSLAGWELRVDDSPWILPDTAVGPGGHLMVWLDGEPSEGALHCPWRLQASGGHIRLARPGGGAVDTVTVGGVGQDLSLCRTPDGASVWRVGSPTPGNANPLVTGMPPLVSDLIHSPEVPLPNGSVTISARVTDPDDDLASVQLLLDHGAGFYPSPMYDDGAHGDGTAGDGIFGAIMDVVEEGLLVRYVVRAEDSSGAVTVYPSSQAPAMFVVGFPVPVLRLNEFMASNAGTVVDDREEYDDWVELHAPGPAGIGDLALFLTDDLSRPDKWHLPPETEVGPGGFLLLWADGQPEQGPLHMPFRLDAAGEELGLFFEARGIFVQLDGLTFGSQTTDVSFGRFPDATGPWGQTVTPTPGAANAPLDAGPPGDSVLPVSLSLEAVWPNPARSLLSLCVGVPQTGQVSLRFYDLAGRVVSRPWDGELAAGRHTLVVPVNLPSGLYVAAVQGSGGRSSRRVVVAPEAGFQPFASSNRLTR